MIENIESCTVYYISQYKLCNIYIYILIDYWYYYITCMEVVLATLLSGITLIDIIDFGLGLDYLGADGTDKSNSDSGNWFG